MRSFIVSSVCVFVILGSGCDTTEPQDDQHKETYSHIRPTWSPDGLSIAFTAEINGTFGIYAVDTSGANLRLIHAGDALGLAWSPNGQKIAYSQQNQIFQVSVILDNPELLVPQAPSIRPSWSPDGARLAYVRSGIQILEVGSGQDTQLYPYGTSPSWKADGSAVLVNDGSFDAATGGNRYMIFFVDAASLVRSDVYAIVTLDDCSFFSISNDERHLIFSRRSAGGYAQIRRLTVATRTEVGLTTDAGDFPAISPDGEWIAYTRPVDGDGGLWLMRVDGSDKRRLTAP